MFVVGCRQSMSADSVMERLFQANFSQ